MSTKFWGRWGKVKASQNKEFSMVKKISFVNLVDLLIGLAVFYLLFVPTAGNVQASHSSTKHNYYVHSKNTHEWVCVDEDSPSITFSTALDRVRNTLRYENPSSDWHALAPDSGSYRIYFEFHANECSTLTASELSPMRGRVYVKDNTSPTSICGASVSCTRQYTALYTHGGYTDYAYGNIFIKTSHLNDTSLPQTYRHTISHEFGHLLGLQDGNLPNSSYCNAPYNQNSIMHPAYYCPSNTTLEWPSSLDRSAVASIAFLITIPPPSVPNQ
jgi:hypothetical protein